jgi:hypothetical protein
MTARSSFDVSYKVVNQFFDRSAVTKRLESANRRALAKAGAFIRKRARTDILRRRKAISPAGSAPSVRSRDKVATLRNILFFYDPKINGVVVGPVKLNQQNRTNNGTVSIPALHEFGGNLRIEEFQFAHQTDNQWFRVDGRRSRRPGERRRKRTAKYPARPFMRAALTAEINAGTIPKAWANSVRG